MDVNKIIEEGKRVLEIEATALRAMQEVIDETFAKIVEDILSCRGKLVITGMGKPGHIGKKLAATFSSLGVPSFFLHPGEAMHGDLGMIDQNDLVIAISYSGESDELISILPNIKMIGARLIALTGNSQSTLARSSDVIQVLPEFEEACNLGLAPTSSTTVALAYGDALAVTVSKVNGFQDIDFGKRHPAGSLGKKIVLRVDDLMAKNDALPVIKQNSLLMDAIKEISNKQLGVVAVVNDDGSLLGVLTDGDIRRIISDHQDIYSVLVDDVMTRNPKTTTPGTLAYNALCQIRQNNINCLPVLDGDILIGIITWQNIVQAGIVL